MCTNSITTPTMPALPHTFYYTIPNVVAAQDDRIADALAVIDNQLAGNDPTD
ncbi:hypothetical protein [Photobacterium gaetbulicola]|uniref:hypothetical protein n=1 Tax=Photobacterium gaetbulicola TaxID=1295392 RepID=UPI000B112A59